MLPSENRRDIKENIKKKIWIYGAPTSGKTTMLDKAPTPLNINTDGNINNVTMATIAIKDIVTVEGRITKRKLAWDVFLEVLDELEKHQNKFETIIIDLVEDLREACRFAKYQELGIKHESEAGFGKAYDVIKTSYLSAMRRFFNLNYTNLIIVSHADMSKDLTKRGGEKLTKVVPNIQEALATKLAGMVDLVGRVQVDDDGKRWIVLKSDDVMFAGNRIGAKTDKIPLEWNELEKIFKK